MAATSLFPPIAATQMMGKAAETYARLQSLFQDEPIPDAFLVFANAPAFMHDYYMNFKRFVLAEGKLDSRTKALVGLSVCIAQKSIYWRNYFITRCRSLGVDDAILRGTAAVAATCTMYNVYFKFRDMSGSDSFAGLPVGLRAFAFGDSGIDEKTVEILNVAISDVNGCKPCTSGHVQKARLLGVSDEALLEAIQAAATVVGGITFLAATSED